MCRRVTCRRCGLVDWSGCGRHVEQVMAGVPASDQCSCSTEETADRPGLFERLRRR